MDTQIEKLKERQYQNDIEIKELEGHLKNSPARRFLPLVTRSGNFRGEIKYITKTQYRKYLRKEPNEAIVDKSGRIPWHYAFDELASEAGYKSDEAFKEDIERVLGESKRLQDLKHEKKMIKQDIGNTSKSVPEIQIITHHSAEPPVFKKSENTTAIVTEVDGLEMTATRNPSFWQVKDNNPSTPDIRVRYGGQARKLMRMAAKDYQQDLAKQRGVKISRSIPRISPRSPRISPKMPKLR